MCCNHISLHVYYAIYEAKLSIRVDDSTKASKTNLNKLIRMSK